MTGNRTHYAVSISSVRSGRENCYGIQRFSADRQKTRVNQSTNHGGLASLIALPRSRRFAPLIVHFSNGASAPKIGPQYQIDGRSIVKKNLLFGIALVLLLGSIECHAERPSQRTDAIQAPTEATVSATHVSTRPGMEPSHLVDPPAAVAKLPNITCRQARPGSDFDCTSDSYLIAIYPSGCSSNGAYGQVSSKTGASTELWDGFPAGNATLIATLKNEQLTCISGEAHRTDSRDIEWYYVTAIPIRTVKACIGKPICESTGDLPIEWVHRPSGQACRIGSDDRYRGDCPSGWIKASDYFEFPMGL